MTINVKYAITALGIILVVGAITQSPCAIMASLVGEGWAKMSSIYWHSAYRRPPSGGKAIRVTRAITKMPSNLSLA